jgi:spore maturation protein CgeB
MPFPLYCSVDPESYYPERKAFSWDLGYIGTYSEDRATTIERLLLQPARRWSDGHFVVAGPQYPSQIKWPPNVERMEHVAPPAHRAFYASQRFTLNVTRARMKLLGHSPSVRLFEAAACGCAIISDSWSGIEQFFCHGEEILIAESSDQVLQYIKGIHALESLRMGRRARDRVLAEHTSDVRARQLESYVDQAFNGLNDASRKDCASPLLERAAKYL